jgi:hypothetical protein
MVVAGMDALGDPAKTFDTSGKSPALFHHRAICKTAHGPAHRALGAITGQKSRQLKLHRNFGASALNPSGSAIARSSTAFGASGFESIESTVTVIPRRGYLGLTNRSAGIFHASLIL